MTMNKGINKFMIVATVLVLLVATVAGYFVWKTNEANIALNTVRNNLSSTINELDATKDELTTTQENLQVEIEKSIGLEESLKSTNEELEIANAIINDLKNEEYHLVYLGNYSITHYCTEKYNHICGTGNGITSTGTTVTAGRTVAVDPNVIPYGTKIYIEGYGWRVAEDCGGAINGRRIDVAVDTHVNADAMGRNNSGVWVLVKN